MMRTTAKLAIFLLTALPFASPATAPGQTHPTRPIRLIVPFPAGGVTDVTARLTGHKLGEALGQTIVIENRPGASGTLGVDAATKATPDGYTLLFTTGDFITAPTLMPKVAFDPHKDLIPIVQVAIAPPTWPTLADSGLAVDAALWVALFAPVGTPQTIVDRLDREVLRMLKEEAVRNRLNALGTEGSGISQKAFVARIQADAARYLDIIKQTGIKVER